MYAIVDIAGEQVKVKTNRWIYVNSIDAEIGDSMTLDRVLLVDTGEEVKVGTPTIGNAEVKAEVLDHFKSDKVKVFKKKRRKGYQKTHGHRQLLTALLINGILIDGEELIDEDAEDEEEAMEMEEELEEDEELIDKEELEEDEDDDDDDDDEEEEEDDVDEAEEEIVDDEKKKEEDADETAKENDSTKKE